MGGGDQGARDGVVVLSISEPCEPLRKPSTRVLVHIFPPLNTTARVVMIFDSLGVPLAAMKGKAFARLLDLDFMLHDERIHGFLHQKWKPGRIWGGGGGVSISVAAWPHWDGRY